MSGRRFLGAQIGNFRKKISDVPDNSGRDRWGQDLRGGGCGWGVGEGSILLTLGLELDILTFVDRC